MGFEYPWMLLIILIAVPLFLLLRRSDRFNEEASSKVKSKPPSKTRFILRYALAAIFAVSLAMVVASPYQEPWATGDYLFLSDTSRSMEARNSCGDLTFLERSKMVMGDVLDGVPEGRFALLAFDRLAFPITQLTYDHSYLKDVLSNGLFIGMSYRATGTNIGNALSVVAQKKQSLPSVYGNLRYVILISDGHLDNAEWREELEEPFRELEEANVRVISVGIGNEVETPIPVTNSAGHCSKRFIEVDGQTVRIPLRPDILRQIASETEGEYFNEGESDALVSFLRKQTLTEVPETAEFTEQQRNNIGWVFLVMATIGLFGFLLL